MAIERAREEIRVFFGRPAAQVAPEFAASWVYHENRREAMQGEAKVLGLQTETGIIRYFTIQEVVVYGDDYTRDRWPKSRSLAIATMEPGEAISYMSQGAHVLTFIKTQHTVGIASAENIMIAGLQEIDRYGTQSTAEDSYLKAAGAAKVLGLGHNGHAQMTPFNFRGQSAFLLSAGNRNWTEEELSDLERDLLSEIEETNP